MVASIDTKKFSFECRNSLSTHLTLNNQDYSCIIINAVSDILDIINKINGGMALSKRNKINIQSSMIIPYLVL